MTSDATESRTFIDIPISGEVNRNYRVKQRNQTELAKLFTAAFAHEVITEVGWRQYTPYFNDGDTCVFRPCAPWVKADDPRADEPHGEPKCGRCGASCDVCDDDDYDEDDVDALTVSTYSEHPVLGGVRDWKTKNYVGNHEDAWRAALALSDAIESGAFNDVLMTLFGDHCTVTVTREKISIDSYEHD